MANEDDCSFQSEEFLRAMAAQDDFDLAHNLQLQEVLTASSSGSFQLHQEDAKTQASHVSSPDDYLFALALQNEELYHSQNQEQDHTLMSREMEQLQLEIKRRAHDAVFARSLMEMDDDEWDTHGDLLENPFNPMLDPSSGAAPKPMVFCKLFVTVAASENNTLFAMGAAVLDSQNAILTELNKLFAPGTSKATADYMALIAGLESIYCMGFQDVEAHTDSVLIYNQVTNRWRVRSRKLQGLLLQAMDYIHKLPTFHMFLEPRNMNQHATRLARDAVGAADSTGQKIKQGTRTCIICLESKHEPDLVKVGECLHEFCLTCIIQHTEVKVQVGQVPVCCPQFGCKTTLSLDQCQTILSQRWFDLLKKRLIEADIPESERVYCPYPTCSALMDKRELCASITQATASSSTSTTRKMCVECARFFCMECRVPWHVSMSCSYYKKLPPERQDAQDAKLHQLAENQKWQRCKKCRRMIELAEGCYHMTCRCGYEFCYLCGKEWKGKAETCGCRLWDEDYLLRQPVNAEAVNGIFEDFDTDSYEDTEFDEVDGRSNFLFVSNPSNPYYKTKLCRYWVRGLCYAGENCNFAHGVHELR